MVAQSKPIVLVTFYKLTCFQVMIALNKTH
jgi:hypothetical protein